jgi:hypothetical protein
LGTGAFSYINPGARPLSPPEKRELQSVGEAKKINIDVVGATGFSVT